MLQIGDERPASFAFMRSNRLLQAEVLLFCKRPIELADAQDVYAWVSHQGEIFAMSGGSANHNRIAGNVYAVLNVAFAAKTCEAFISDMRLMVQANGL